MCAFAGMCPQMIYMQTSYFSTLNETEVLHKNVIKNLHYNAYVQTTLIRHFITSES